jgi:hypothetical protein
MMAALRTSETSFITIATRRNIPKDGILHSHRRENLHDIFHRLCNTLQTNRPEKVLHLLPFRVHRELEIPRNRLTNALCLWSLSDHWLRILLGFLTRSSMTCSAEVGSSGQFELMKELKHELNSVQRCLNTLVVACFAWDCRIYHKPDRAALRSAPHLMFRSGPVPEKFPEDGSSHVCVSCRGTTSQQI